MGQEKKAAGAGGGWAAWGLLAIAAALGVWSAMWGLAALEQRHARQLEQAKAAAEADAEKSLAWARAAAEAALSLPSGGEGRFEPEALRKWEESLERLGIGKALEESNARLTVEMVWMESPGRESPLEPFPFEGCALARARSEGGEEGAGWLAIRGVASGEGESMRLSGLEAQRGAAGCKTPADYLRGAP